MMTRRTSLLAALLCIAAVSGCGGMVPESGDVVQVSGKVPVPSGKSVKGFQICFQPTGGKARQGQFPLEADGSFSGELTKGKYTYYLTPGKGNATEKALESFPESYRQGSLERQVDVEGGEIQLKF